ncbi:hypothetical protein TSUD_261460 [Trifolium subterraneum]|nr:hypothetical protein TSUD_261460 [Trifolium subterraneum]
MEMEMETMKNTVLPPYLPKEMIFQILVRLPVKSLIKFKCVCKFWFFIISSDTDFANTQFQLTASTHTQRVLLMTTISTPRTRSVDLEALDDTKAFTSHKYPASLLKTSDLLSLVEMKGSCRGFILFICYSNLSLYVWNPSTGVNKQIPLSPLCLENKVEEYFYGFGYDPLTDDYLIVSLSSDINSSYLEFFSFRANMYKQIDEGTQICYLSYNDGADDACEPGLLFNGSIHWFAYRPDLKNDVIVAFDLMERKLLDMHLPDQFDDHTFRSRGLWVFQEFLSLWTMDYGNYDTLEIWVMKEYKLHSSWTKTHVLPIIDDIPFKYIFPLTSTKSGDIVATDGVMTFVKYNDEGQVLWHCDFYNPHGSGTQVVMYTESLLSLPGDNVQA